MKAPADYGGTTFHDGGIRMQDIWIFIHKKLAQMSSSIERTSIDPRGMMPTVIIQPQYLSGGQPCPVELSTVSRIPARVHIISGPKRLFTNKRGILCSECVKTDRRPWELQRITKFTSNGTGEPRKL